MPLIDIKLMQSVLFYYEVNTFSFTLKVTWSLLGLRSGWECWLVALGTGTRARLYDWERTLSSEKGVQERVTISLCPVSLRARSGCSPVLWGGQGSALPPADPGAHSVGQEAKV